MKMPRYQAAGIRRNSPVRHLKKAKYWEESAIIFGRELFVYRAKMGGIILYQTISLCIMKDTPMVSYGTWDEDTQGKIEVGCEVCGNEKHKHGHHHHKSEGKAS